MERFTKRADAAAAGAIIYYPERPCLRGHTDGRYTKSGACVGCRRQASIDLYKETKRSFNHQAAAESQG